MLVAEDTSLRLSSSLAAEKQKSASIQAEAEEAVLAAVAIEKQSHAQAIEELRDAELAHWKALQSQRDKEWHAFHDAELLRLDNEWQAFHDAELAQTVLETEQKLQRGEAKLEAEKLKFARLEAELVE